MYSLKKTPYTINLDPACLEVPYPCNIDIRDTVNYKEVMKQYSLGPNGAIITSLNLFSTKFEQVIELIEKRANECEYVLLDTPGQIEVFTWSASGSIITETLVSENLDQEFKINIYHFIKFFFKGVAISNHSRLCDGYATKYESGYIYVKHAIRLFYIV